MLKRGLKGRFLMFKKRPKREVFIFFITLLCYNTNVGGMHGSAFFVSNLEQLALKASGWGVQWVALC